MTRKKRLRIATFSTAGFSPASNASLDEVADACETYWGGQFQSVLPDKPDLIVLPECASRPNGFGEKEHTVKLQHYYDRHGDRLVEFCRRIAAEHNTTIACSCVRRLEDDGLYNCTTVIGPTGETLGLYCKNHLVIDENECMGITYGRQAEVIDTPCGRVACAICFDLNFDELREHYRQARPDLILFSSVYHGGAQQMIWPYLCRAHFVGAMAVNLVPAEIRNPFGQILHTTTNYHQSVVGQVNLDCELAHLDYNWTKLDALKAKYGPHVTILDPGCFGSVLVSSESDSVSARDMLEEFDIEGLDDYMTRARAHRETHA